MTTSIDHDIFLADTDDQIADCFDCMRELRPDIDRDTFVSRVRRMQKEGFLLAGIAAEGTVVAVTGYRYIHNLFAGSTLYVDDLVTSSSQRSKGYGAALLDWLRQQANNNNCQMLHLDSGTQRFRAHEFYFANGMHIASFHFAEHL